MSWRGFTQEEIQYAISNCNVDWKDRCRKYIRYLDSDNLSKDQIVTALTEKGFKENDALAAVNNEDIDWSEQIFTYIIDVLAPANRYPHSSCKQCGEFSGEYPSCPLCGSYVQVSSTYGLTKNDTVNRLIDAGFPEDDIQATITQHFGEQFFFNKKLYKNP